MLIEISNRQQMLEFDEARLKRAVEAVITEARITEAEVSIALVDDATIHVLNRQYLAHDYPTDVLSFALERDERRLEGEVIASAETAIRSAARLGWSADEELLLYVIHGTLHLVGYDDATPEQREVMCTQEAHHLAQFGLERRA
ncbi:MAG: rRNA maturation RNase YbeY [Planctomycetia bacterium]|nr:rRNA maturation RNase YbeY [Planctomycetia bacterium]